MDTTTEAEQALRATTDDGLLDALLILTHRLHVSREVKQSRLPNPALPGVTYVTYVSAHRNEQVLRSQRDLVRAEIIRRMQP